MKRIYKGKGSYRLSTLGLERADGNPLDLNSLDQTCQRSCAVVEVWRMYTTATATATG